MKKNENRAVQDARMPRAQDAQERPLFVFRADNFSGREIGRYLVAPVGRGPGAKRIKRKVQRTFLPLSGFAMEGEPRLSSKAGTAKRRKVRVKKAMDGLFQRLKPSDFITAGSCAQNCSR